MRSLRQRLAEQEGFTLIELLVVIVIIGILLAIAVPSYLGFKGRAEQKAAAANVRAAIPDAEAYYADNGNYTAMDLAAPAGDRLGRQLVPRREGRGGRLLPVRPAGLALRESPRAGRHRRRHGYRELRDRSRLVRTTSTMHVREGAGDRALPFVCRHGTSATVGTPVNNPLWG